ncbi:hypothetical protein STA1M1_34430 [Sinisalibacter aestuarii]|uniref:DUF6603 domain-containing protein n=2 Tax=Sinisalibacter aestuarii TaxID=2949426 RepID=A0ABQ5LXC5_9RHOB|nr:hypothetical protein STA1M1_34430 [Sinisalibacter aestuarii]
MAIPSEAEVLVEINIDSLGVLEFEGPGFLLDSTIRDSHVLHLFELSGDIALRMALGEAPIMLVSKCGFHPDFRPPPGVPALARLKAMLPLDDCAEVTLATCFAVSRTVSRPLRRSIWCWRNSAPA